MILDIERVWRKRKKSGSHVCKALLRVSATGRFGQQTSVRPGAQNPLSIEAAFREYLFEYGRDETVPPEFISGPGPPAWRGLLVVFGLPHTVWMGGEPISYVLDGRVSSVCFL